jgi:hypothetical protein
MDAAHHVVHDRADRHRIRDGIHAEVARGELAHERQPLVDYLFPEMAHIQEHAIAPPGRHGIAFLLLVPESLAHTIAGTEFHGLQHRTAHGRLRPHAVVLQIAIAVPVDEDTALAPARLGEQASRVRKTGRVVLDEFHVLERNPRAVCHGHAIARLDRAIGAEGEHAAGATASDDYRPRLELLHLPAAHLDRDEPLAAPVVHQQVGGVIFVEALDRRILERGLEQRMENVEA